MATPPKIPDVAPQDKAWFRWANEQLQGHHASIERLGTRVSAVVQQHTTTSSNTANNSSTVSDIVDGKPVTDVVPPQQPTDPQLATSRGVVTIRWDGVVYASVSPDPTIEPAKVPPGAGFSHVNVYRYDTTTHAWHVVGGPLTHAGVIVDADVTVGDTVYYRLLAQDILGRTSSPSKTVTIIVAGVDLGSLDSDLKQLITDLNTSTTTGGLVYYGDVAPTDPKYQDATSLWFDTSDPSGAVPNRWDLATSKWVPIPWGTGALGDGSIVASKILAGAIDTAALGAGSVTAQKIGAGAVVAEKIGANAVTANSIAAHAVEADKIAVGAVSAQAIALDAVVPSATPINRVPQALNNQAYWQQIVDGTINLGSIDPLNVRTTTDGIIFDPSTTDYAFLPITAMLPLPVSHAVHVHFGPDNSNVSVMIRYDRGGGFFTEQAGSNDSVIDLDTTAKKYGIFLRVAVNGVTSTVKEASVFEVIGIDKAGQSAQLSPAGLRLFNDSGQLAVDLSTSTDNFLSIYNAGDARATIDENGDGTFQDLQVNGDITVGGVTLLDGFDDYERMDGTMSGPYIFRLPLGIVYMATWDTLHNLTVTTQYQRIASGSFSLPGGREYLLNADLGGLQVSNASGVNIYVELQLSTTPIAQITDGTVVQRAVVYDGKEGNFVLNPIIFRAGGDLSGIDLKNNFIPGETDIYWQINTNLSAVPTASYQFKQYSPSTSLTITDIGKNLTALQATDRTTGGGTATGSAGSGTVGTSTNKTVTKTWTATWSASWHDSGATKVVGTGTYTDADRLYQGLGVTAMGAKFGFPDLTSTLNGKTISKVEVWLQNRWTYYTSGGTAYLAGHSNASEPSTFGSTVSGTGFSSSFTRGQGKWITIGNGTIPFSSWKSGAVRGLALTIRGSDTEYAYYDGVGKTYPPKLRITYS